ncbi:hypothetical protein D3C72_2261270 [compost metagenome]
MALVGEVFHPADHLVLVGQHVVEHRRAVAGDRGGTGGHGHGYAGLGALDMVGTVQLLGHAVFGVGRFVGGGDDAVAQGEVLELVRLKQRVI